MFKSAFLNGGLFAAIRRQVHYHSSKTPLLKQFKYVLYVDASFGKAYGGVAGTGAVLVESGTNKVVKYSYKDHEKFSKTGGSTLAEVRALLDGLVFARSVLGSSFTSDTIVVKTDNQSVVDCLKNKTYGSPEFKDLYEQVETELKNLNVASYVAWVERDDTQMADALANAGRFKAAHRPGGVFKHLWKFIVRARRTGHII